MEEKSGKRLNGITAKFVIFESFLFIDLLNLKVEFAKPTAPSGIKGIYVVPTKREIHVW